MGHRDLLVTHNLSEAKNHGCRPHPRGSVRRASGFVLTGKQEGTELLLVGRRFVKLSAKLQLQCSHSFPNVRELVWQLLTHCKHCLYARVANALYKLLTN